jgi:hypothetical protein
VLPACLGSAIPLLEIDVEAPFFGASDNVGQKRLMLTSKAMTGEQKSTDGDTLILVLGKNVWHPYSQLLDLTHKLQMSEPISLANSRVVRLGSVWIKAFRRSSSKLDGRPKRGVSLMSKLPCLKHANQFWAVLSARVFSVDGTNVLGGLCSFGASTELVKKKVSEKFIFLNLTLHSFGPENFIPLVQIGKFQTV